MVWFYLVTFNFSPLKSKKIDTQITHTLFLASKSIFNILIFLDALWASQFEFKSYVENITLKICFAPDCGATAKQWLAT